jgi:signal transduction histidine kinase
MATAWSTQQLAEFVAAVSAARSEATAALTAVERAAETLDADVAAIVGGGEVIASVGYPAGAAPVSDLEAVASGGAASYLDVPGVGRCAAACAPLDHPPGAKLVVARPGTEGLSREESGLLRAMARVASLTLRMLHGFEEERAAREELEALAREQAGLRRVATLVAEAADPDAVFSAVAEEVAQLAEADMAKVLRYEDDGTATVVGGWGDPEPHLAIGARLSLEGEGVAISVRRTGQPARNTRFRGPPGSLPDAFHQAGVQTGCGNPILVEGRLWGVVIAVRTRPEPLPPAAERRIEAFTGLVATAIANAEAHAQLTASRARVVATADETRRRIVRDLHDGAQQRLVQTVITLKLAQRAQKADDHAAARALVGDALEQASQANAALRELAHGILPAVLAAGGLAAATNALVSRLRVPVTVDVARDRLPAEIEANAYFVIAEALTNVAKHSGARRADVRSWVDDGMLHVDVRDDGVGGARRDGSGLVGLDDRVRALGGRLWVDSPRGEGTRIVATLPLPR